MGMIGYDVGPQNAWAVGELFELLKVPAEPYAANGDYRLIVTDHSSSTVDESPVPRLNVGWVLDLVNHLLDTGQADSSARTLPLDTALANLRAELRTYGALVEVAPVPWGYDCIVTLSHDVDHLSFREHGFGLWWLSALRQSTLWPLQSALSGRMTWRNSARAWRLALASPLVLLGAVPDPWTAIDAYLPLEHAYGAHSTFYFIPFKGRPGRALAEHAVSPRRAAAYDLRGHHYVVRRLIEAGCEVGVHGLDAWVDVHAGQAERARVEEAAGQPVAGIRMHYLFYDADTFRRLDQAGYAYDSTFGYRNRVGFRAGTLQPFRPRGCDRLLENPVHLEDGCLLSPSAEYAHPGEARAVVCQFLDLAKRHGGCLNVSWHDHSLAPPRLWGETYRVILEEAVARNAWLARVGDATEWFARRREISLAVTGRCADSLTLRVELPRAWPTSLPRPRLRIHAASPSPSEPPTSDHGCVYDAALEPGVFEVRTSATGLGVRRV